MRHPAMLTLTLLLSMLATLRFCRPQKLDP
jgi:hypothetical protein